MLDLLALMFATASKGSHRLPLTTRKSELHIDFVNPSQERTPARFHHSVSYTDDFKEIIH